MGEGARAPPFTSRRSWVRGDEHVFKRGDATSHPVLRATFSHKGSRAKSSLYPTPARRHMRTRYPMCDANRFARYIGNLILMRALADKPRLRA